MSGDAGARAEALAEVQRMVSEGVAGTNATA
jgi:hypothetical protein